MTETKKPVICSKTNKILCYVDEKAVGVIWVYCKSCKAEHKIELGGLSYEVNKA